MSNKWACPNCESLKVRGTFSGNIMCDNCDERDLELSEVLYAFAKQEIQKLKADREVLVEMGKFYAEHCIESDKHLLFCAFFPIHLELQFKF
jgi:uncharacterized Zn finger protein (UPF0148 family)